MLSDDFCCYWVTTQDSLLQGAYLHAIGGIEEIVNVVFYATLFQETPSHVEGKKSILPHRPHRAQAKYALRITDPFFPSCFTYDTEY